MSHKPGYISPNRPLNVRIQPQGRKEEFVDIAYALGDTPSEVINGFIAWYLSYNDDLPTRPEVRRQGPRLEATA